MIYQVLGGCFQSLFYIWFVFYFSFVMCSHKLVLENNILVNFGFNLSCENTYFL